MEPVPKISIIIPTYNRALTLATAIDSILTQSYSDFEVLIIDDSSNDNTAQLVGELIAKDARIHYFRLEENQGVGYARDFGLHQARGAWIAWLDSDDRWLPEKLSSQIKIVETYPEIDLLFGDFWNIVQNTGRREKAAGQYGFPPEYLHVDCPEDELLLIENGLEQYILQQEFIHFQTVLMRREIVEQMGGIAHDLRIAEDFEFFFRAAMNGLRFAYLDLPLVERYKGDGSLTQHGSFAWSQKLAALEKAVALIEMNGRGDLRSLLWKEQERAICNLLRNYGERNKRLDVLSTFVASLRFGISLKILKWTGLGLLGPRAIKLINERSK